MACETRILGHTACMLLHKALNVTIDAADAQGRLPWQDVREPVEQRIQALMSNMTLDQKISQLSSNSGAIEHLDIPAFNWWTGEPFPGDLDHQHSMQSVPVTMPSSSVTPSSLAGLEVAMS